MVCGIGLDGSSSFSMRIGQQIGPCGVGYQTGRGFQSSHFSSQDRQGSGTCDVARVVLKEIVVPVWCVVSDWTEAPVSA